MPRGLTPLGAKSIPRRQRIAQEIVAWTPLLMAAHWSLFRTCRTFSSFVIGAIAPPMEESARRSRQRRISTGKRIELTERDLAIFGTLGRYRYLRSTYLHAFVGGKSLTRFKERLGDLFHEGYLDRPTAQWLLPDSRYVPVVYELGRVAEHVLTTVGAGQFDKATWLGGRMHRQFAHSVMICECLASIELETKLNAVRFIPWSEILARSPDATRRSAQPFRISISNNLGVVPDAIFGLEYDVQGKRLYRFFALEVDRATMPIRRSACDQSSYLAKLAAYREVTAKQVYRARLNLPNLLVLTVTTNERRMKTIMDGLGNEGAPIFLFKWFDEVSRRPGPLLSGAWKRCGLPPLDLTAAG